MFVPSPPPQGPSPPSSPPQGPPSPPTAPPASLPPVDHKDGEPEAEGSGASGAVHMLVDTPDFLELIVISSDDEEELAPEEETKSETNEGDQTFVEQLEQEL